MEHLIEPYNTAWKTEFDDLKRVLLHLLDGYAIDIQHVGSTAIPGLFAKPILDIDIILHNKALLEGIAARLEQAGYHNRGDQGIPGRFAFRQISDLTPKVAPPKQWQAHHLYVCFVDSLALKNHLLFRDALLKDQRLVAEYAQLKINLTKEPNMTRASYNQRKTDFILAVLAANGLSEPELDAIKKANI